LKSKGEITFEAKIVVISKLLDNLQSVNAFYP